MQRARRLIPAHAGKTAVAPRAPPARPAHPRSRGENGKSKLTIANELGSSPLTRGKPSAAPGAGRSAGLIPAHAGKTREVCHIQDTGGAHPRSRGENVGLLKGDQIQTGSSPLTRGKRLQQVNVSEANGLIPAHAGKT